MDEGAALRDAIQALGFTGDEEAFEFLSKLFQECLAAQYLEQVAASMMRIDRTRGTEYLKRFLDEPLTFDRGCRHLPNRSKSAQRGMNWTQGEKSRF